MSITSQDIAQALIHSLRTAPPWVLLVSVAATLVGVCVLLYRLISVAAPDPRPPYPSEKTFVHAEADGSTSTAQTLPCWLDRWAAERFTQKEGSGSTEGPRISPAEVFVTLVIPAYNEEQRLPTMLNEAIDYLEANYPNDAGKKKKKSGSNPAAPPLPAGARPGKGDPTGWEIVLVSDGSTDKTVATALKIGHERSCGEALRLVALEENRGKGGAVVHGMRHARGAYVLFADADGATKFADLGRVVEACRAAEDGDGRGVAVGSRAHLVGSEAVVRRSFLRNLLMHGFHLLIKTLTPPATARIRDTQCGFKLFSRPALPHIVPYMHSEGWIFDVEMLMLAEGAPAVGSGPDSGPGIAIAEVPVGWHEVVGSKLNVVWDSLGMAWGLAILRLAWGTGVYRRW